MKKYYFNNYKIIKLNKYLKNCYNSNYIITINNDIIDFANTLKQAKNIIKSI